MVAAQLLDVAHVLGVQQRLWPVGVTRAPVDPRDGRARARAPCAGPPRSRRRSPRTADAASAAGSRARAGSRSMRASGVTSAIALCGGVRPQVERRGLADALLGPAAANSDAYSASVRRRAFGRGGVRSCSSVGEEPRLLALRHVDLRVAAQHLVQRRRAALGLPDDEEVGQPAARGRPRVLPLTGPPAARRSRPWRPAVKAGRRRARWSRSARRCGSSGCAPAGPLSCRTPQAAVEDHHHAIAHVERRHAVGDDEQRQLVLERRPATPGSASPSAGPARWWARRARAPAGRAASARARQMRCC